MKPFNLAEARIVERNYCQDNINGRLRIIVLMTMLCLIISGASFVCKAMIGGQVRQTTSSLADAQGRCADVKREMQTVNTSLTELKWQEMARCPELGDCPRACRYLVGLNQEHGCHINTRRLRARGGV